MFAPWRVYVLKLSRFKLGGVLISSKNLSYSKCYGHLLKSSQSFFGNSRHFSTSLQENDVFKNIDEEAITKGDENLLKSLKILMLEFEVVRQEGKDVPTVMSTDKWTELLRLKSRSQRLKLLSFWRLKEKLKEKDRRKKLEKQANRKKELEEKDKENVEDGHIIYGFGGSTIFIRVHGSSMDRWHNAKLIEAMMFGQDLVIDCGYDVHMNHKESSNCAKQLGILFAQNRIHKSPFNLHFVNVDREGVLMTNLKKTMPTMYEPEFPLNITSESYLTKFPKEKLVYLTPHCREDLTKYSHDDIYIIGAMVDKQNIQPLSLGKAKAEGLRMARLPLDRYLDWCLGTKSLTLDQMIKIMLDMKVTGDWLQAFKHVPQRKLQREENIPNQINKMKKFPFLQYQNLQLKKT